jgi:hypothetical protein
LNRAEGTGVIQGKRRPSDRRETFMTSPLHDGSRPSVPWPVPVSSWPSFYLSGSADGTAGALTAPGRWSVHRRCATDVRRGTHLLAGRSRAHRVKTGARTPRGKRADGGLRTGRVPDAGEATPAHAPVSPPGSRAGVVALRAPVRTAPPLARELRQQTHERCQPGQRRGSRPEPRADWPPPTPAIFPPALCSVRVKAGFGMRGDRHGSRAERRFSA